MEKNGGSNEEVKDHQFFETAGFIDALIDEKFVNFNPRRDIYNVTFTFPISEKKDISDYIKRNGKADIVKMIVGEVKRCQNAEVK